MGNYNNNSVFSKRWPFDEIALSAISIQVKLKTWNLDLNTETLLQPTEGHRDPFKTDSFTMLGNLTHVHFSACVPIIR